MTEIRDTWLACTVTLLIFGLLGNGLTIWAIGYATIRKKYEFGGAKWLTTTVFILNLAFLDTVYCLFMIAYIFCGLLLRKSVIDIPLNEDGSSGICQFFVLGFQQLSLMEGWSIALIAITRGIPYIK